jgi:hypothetical protein
MAAVPVVAVACAALRFASELWASAVLTATIGMLLTGVLGMVLRRGPARAFWFGFTVFGSAYLILAFAPWCSTNIRPQLLTSKLLGYAHRKMAPYGSAPAFTGVAFIDLDADGMLDIHVANGATPNVLLRNVADPAGTPAPDRGLGVVTGDLDGDGWADLFVTNANPAQNVLYRNLGNGKFADVTTFVAGLRSGPSWEHFEQVGHSLFGLLVALVGGLLARYVFARRISTDGSGAGADSC